MDCDGELEVDFLNYSTALLEHLNKHRVEGKFCDISIHVQGQVFKAHKAVLAASSRYFHDQLLLSDSNFIVLPDVLDPTVFEKILASAYTGRLCFSMDDIGSYLTLGSFLQMWHVVDKCNEFLKRGCLLSKAHSSRSSENQSPSSSNFFGCRDVGESWGVELPKSCLMGKEQPEGGDEHHVVVQRDMNQNVSVQAVCTEVDSGVSEGENCSFKSIAHMPIDLTDEVKQELPDEVISHRQRRENQKDLNTVPSVGPLEQLMNIAEIRSFSGLDFGASSSETSDFSGHPCPPEGQAELNEDHSFPPTDMQSSRTGNHRGTSHLSHGPVEHTSRYGKKIYSCLCGKRFPEKGRRDRHVILRISMRPFACSLCSKKFKLKHHLNEHMVVHMDRKLHECYTCGKKFKMFECFQRHRENCERLNSTDAVSHVTSLG